MRPVRIGLSGWNYAHWRDGVFYPPRLPASRWLELYAERFDTVEVNSTFYRLPRRDAVARWLEQTPNGFLFSVKASRYLTHVKRLRDLGPGLERFLERIEPVGGAPARLEPHARGVRVFQQRLGGIRAAERGAVAAVARKQRTLKFLFLPCIS